ncbi:hypothetical protein RF55_12793 [Lasius niger]|uniref:Uncharacterized protein n=1 Tax=Lasius niger TaxID=67767 RepID=A0A0J7KC05_LASNI|nr:hypothetical protein RF55_12793 [Lasius niger]
MSMDMDCLILAQDDLQNRMASTMENLNKLGKANITVEAIEELKTSKYIKGDFAGLAEETYLSQKTKLMKMKIALPVQHAGGNSAGIESSSARQRTTLPRIQLPHFSGKYADWPPFRNLFRSVIGMDTSISDVEKLHYLKASLKVELLDSRSRRDWEDVIGGTSEPATYTEVKEFLEKRMQTLEALHPQKPEAAPAKSGDAGTRFTRTHHAQKQEV